MSSFLVKFKEIQSHIHFVKIKIATTSNMGVNKTLKLKPDAQTINP